ncbi:hypothetical protein AB0M12_37675 [Nocardia vinacea]|uniref:hypothetical protein n=1 Tax=Nocardia vinacea TaxID=96468 RepID=UPI003418609D
MSDTEIVDAEYRAFIKELHPATVDTVVAVEVYWMQKLFPTVVGISARADDDDDDDRGPLERSEDELDAEFRHVIEPKLLTLVHGHPDPDVRDAADYLDKRLWGGLFYLHPLRAARQGGEEVTVALQLVHDALSTLRRTVYHAPFRIDCPVPRYTGEMISSSEPLPTRIVRDGM